MERKKQGVRFNFLNVNSLRYIFIICAFSIVLQGCSYLQKANFMVTSDYTASINKVYTRVNGKEYYLFTSIALKDNTEWIRNVVYQLKSAEQSSKREILLVYYDLTNKPRGLLIKKIFISEGIKHIILHYKKKKLLDSKITKNSILVYVSYGEK